MLRTVAVLVQRPVSLFELGVFAEVFGIDRTDDGVPRFELLICADEAGRPIPAEGGLTVTAPLGLEHADRADLVAVLPADPSRPAPPAVLDTLRRAHARGAYVMSVFGGTFTLAQTGLLDGQVCATHWRQLDAMAQRHPRVFAQADTLYAQSGRIITSAGTAAGIDACLHVIRLECGADIAARVARRMVIPPHREGGQKQYVDSPVAEEAQGLQPVLEWAMEHLAERHTVASLAARAGMSSRTFARRFAAEVGSSPNRWLTTQRVLRARQVLERTDRPIERVAHDVGFASATLLRHHFQERTGITPTAYRRQFTLGRSQVVDPLG